MQQNCIKDFLFCWVQCHAERWILCVNNIRLVLSMSAWLVFSINWREGNWGWLWLIIPFQIVVFHDVLFVTVFIPNECQLKCSPVIILLLFTMCDVICWSSLFWFLLFITPIWICRVLTWAALYSTAILSITSNLHSVVFCEISLSCLFWWYTCLYKMSFSISYKICSFH